MEYQIERLDAAGWTIVGTDPVSGWAQHYMRAKRRLFPNHAFRVVECPSRRLVVCEGGPALGMEAKPWESVPQLRANLRLQSCG